MINLDVKFKNINMIRPGLIYLYVFECLKYVIILKGVGVEKL